MFKSSAIVLAAALLLAGCQGLSHRENRALTGAAVGGAGGALIGGVTGGSALVGGLVGAAGGAAVGALTAPEGKR
ncbi:hypothetical protein [Azospirillum halopraeferens]|uniref:hypothetical protein n=1 Tax=Azospirillum halopraeferens TaxID=34010 RepID=UPI0004265F78|nr:hypothetical protein [Azospirillum halopraeferens]